MSLDSGLILRELLEIHKITKWKLSKLLGVSWQTVHSWSRGAFKPSSGHAERLAAILTEYSGKTPPRVPTGPIKEPPVMSNKNPHAAALGNLRWAKERAKRLPPSAGIDAPKTAP